MLKRKFLADKATCSVTFTTDAGITREAKAAAVVGSFNNWDATANPMKRRKDGTFATTVKLPCGESHQFRYLIDESRWENDVAADHYVPTPFGDSANSVVDLH